MLLIRRANPPRAGQWSIPGGRIEWGETAKEAALRELREETGVEAEMLGLVDVVDAFFPSASEPDAHFVLIDFAVRWIGGAPVAGDDASDAGFVRRGELKDLGLWPETARVIERAFERWGLPSGAG